MTITGLDNNYYLSQNDIWISISGFIDLPDILELIVTNITTGASLPILRMSPSPENEFKCNICVPVRALFPFPDHININSLQSFGFDFIVKFEDTNIADETISLTKYFVLGGRNKNGNAEWFLTASEELIVGKWLEWRTVTLPGYAKRIQGNAIVDFIPTEKVILNKPSGCDYKILKFLNSLGGYQYYLFDKFQEKYKSKAGKTIPKIADRLRQHNMRNREVNTERTIEFQTKTPFAAQSVITDLIASPEVLLYDSTGDDSDSQWERLVIENNDSIENNWNRVYENKLEFSFSKYINRTI
ncbi:hypothetical protein D1632_10755 [Chryseobacterium nematophagum]|uniref:Uncharacterized protein n=1 Tax=Chryseobacterium nematophagum TaxID=2305228 RepID=A0A3M7LDJ0_9FLAO|nr:hypothetical protein [Chryseobacterium nematophagum]RMZ60060.1 hypothetical protein D1632_10755 [Chryseobacterium nematophagum]